jgi:hypothetical protein
MARSPGCQLANRDGIAASMRMDALFVMKLRGLIGRESSCERLYDTWLRSMPCHGKVYVRFHKDKAERELLRK